MNKSGTTSIRPEEDECLFYWYKNIFKTGRVSMRKNWVTSVLGIAAVAAIGFLGAGCGNDTQTASSSASTEKVVKMGVTQGLHAEIMEEVKKEEAKQGINMEIVEFSDFVTPDVALDNGEIDMNSIQHQPFLDNVV